MRRRRFFNFGTVDMGMIRSFRDEFYRRSREPRANVETAQAASVEVKVVSSLYHFLPGLEQKPSMVMIDLDATGISPTTLY